MDKLDVKILELLQQDGRMSNVDISESVHLSPPQCLRRVRALEEQGVIRRYAALVAPSAVGLDVTALSRCRWTGRNSSRCAKWKASSGHFPKSLSASPSL